MLKLNVGFHRKVGEPNYSSRGASVNLELELDSGLVGDSDRLKERICSLFRMAKGSVDEELTGAAPGNTNGTAASQQATSANGNGSSTRGRRDATRAATASQVRALYAIADRQGTELADLLRARYGLDQPEALSITEASELIDHLKGSANQATNGGGR